MCIQLGKYVSRVTRDDVIASTRMDAWLTALEDRFVEKCTLIGWWAWQSVCNYFMSDWVDTNAEFSDYVCLTSDVPYICRSTQGVRSRRNVRESRRFLAPLAEGQRAIVMAWGRRASVRPFVRSSVRASVNFFFKKLLLRDYWLDFNQISQECSLGGPLSNSFK